MCKNNTCHMYAKRWSCPPGCGDLEVCRKKIEKYREGIIVQTVGKLEDPLDGETMMETEAVHKQNFYEFEKMLRERWPGMLPIGAGCCTKCKTCTYPDAPCRFPEQAFSSMHCFLSYGQPLLWRCWPFTNGIMAICALLLYVVSLPLFLQPGFYLIFS